MKVRLRPSFLLSSREQFADQLHLGKRPRQQSLFSIKAKQASTDDSAIVHIRCSLLADMFGDEAASS